MSWIKRLSWLQLLALIAVPLTAWAITWTKGSYSAPQVFRDAVSRLGLNVAQVCRPDKANYGAKGSLHKRCLAMDISKNTPKSKLDALRGMGLCPEFHPKGYYGATADHYHVVRCSDSKSRKAARQQTRRDAGEIRRQNRRSSTGSRGSRPSSYRPSSYRPSSAYTGEGGGVR